MLISDHVFCQKIMTFYSKKKGKMSENFKLYTHTKCLYKKLGKISKTKLGTSNPIYLNPKVFKIQGVKVHIF